MRRLGRSRGFGCLGCLPLGGLIVTLIPLILIGAVIYWLVSRQKTAAPPPAAPLAGPPGSYFCSRCGNPMNAGEKFCAGCGNRVG